MQQSTKVYMGNLEVNMIDWEMKARQLAENLRVTGFLLGLSGVLALVMGEDWVKAFGAYLVLAGAGVMRGARIES